MSNDQHCECPLPIPNRDSNHLKPLRFCVFIFTNSPEVWREKSQTSAIPTDIFHSSRFRIFYKPLAAKSKLDD